MRICLYSGPNSGKSKTAARLYGDPALSSYRIELVREFVKEWAYLGRKITGFDQVKIFGEQLHLEELVLKYGHGTHIITDSPLWLQLVYAKKYGVSCVDSLVDIVKDFDSKHPSIHIMLDRGDIPYSTVGRYETESEAKTLDKEIRSFLTKNDIEYQEFFTKDYKAIFEYVKYRLDKEGK